MSQLDQDFEAYLEDSFNVFQFSNIFMKATNQSTKDTVDFNTPIKKLKYDLEEIETRQEGLIKSNYQHLINQLEKTDSDGKLLKESLKPSLEYIDLSYSRLNNQVLVPYQKAVNLQLALNKIHQTNTLLRSFFTLSSLILQARSIDLSAISVDSMDSADLAKSTTFVSQLSDLTLLHQQIDLQLISNNVSKLQIISAARNEFIQPQKLLLIKKITDFINKIFVKNYKKISNLGDQLLKLFLSLYTLNQNQLLVSLDKIISTKFISSSQILNKSITSIKHLETNLNEIASNNMQSIIFLENKILKNCKLNSKNMATSDYETAVLSESTSSTTFSSKSFTSMSALSKYIHHYEKSNSEDKFPSILYIYWYKIAKSFKTEYNINLKRGGPVGKSLGASRDFIAQTIEQVLTKEIPDSYADKNDIIALMKNTVSTGL